MAPNNTIGGIDSDGKPKVFIAWEVKRLIKASVLDFYTDIWKGVCNQGLGLGVWEHDS